MTPRLFYFGLMALSMALAPTLASAAIVPVESGLVLNFQANNIDGLKNATMVNGQEVTLWKDVIVPGGHQTAHDATAQGAIDYLNPLSTTTGTPNYVAVSSTGKPGVQFTRVSGSAGDALGINTIINGLSVSGGFTAFVVGDLANPGPSRILQFGARGGGNGNIVALGNRGFRYNGNEKTFVEDQLTAAEPTIATYSMDLSQAVGADGVNAIYRVDGVNGTISTIGNAAAIIGITNHGFAIGGGQSNTSAVIDSLNGTLYAVLLYNRVLSAQEINDVEEYLTRFVPEPSSYVLMGVSAVFAIRYGRRRHQVKA